MTNIKNCYLVDIGNSAIKSAISTETDIGEISYWQNLDDLFKSLPKDAKIWISNVGVSRNELTRYTASFPNVQLLTNKTNLPVILEYDTPETLGADRIAAVIAASEMFKEKTSLVIDLGTCITLDLIENAKEYKGGFIVPGIKLRLKSMHDYTAALPDLSASFTPPDYFQVGKSTIASMEFGVFQGLLSELEGLIEKFQHHYPEIVIVMSGGDARFFESKIKKTIFVRPNLVLTGLNRIMRYNEV